MLASVRKGRYARFGSAVGDMEKVKMDSLEDEDEDEVVGVQKMGWRKRRYTSTF